ncbi:MAG: phage portal protein [Desulfurellales bacterium]|nr:MAG: phage portal protein [Desulfurellales bacterium]
MGFVGHSPVPLGTPRAASRPVRTDSALNLFAVLRRYTNATLTSAEIAAAFSILLKTNSAAGIPPAELEAFAQIAYHHGGVATLPEGWDMVQLKAENPHTLYNDFKRAIIAEIARCLNMPYNVAAADSSGHSYSSGRLDYQIYGTDVEVDQEYYARECLDRIFAAWLQESILAKVLPIEAVLAETAHAWQWDPLTDIDPQKTRAAQAEALKSGLTSLPTEYARLGLDWRVEMIKQAKALGLTLSDYQARVAANLLPAPPVPPTPAVNASESTPVGEMANLSRRQFTNNVKAIREILDGVVDGSTPEFIALNLLLSLGLPEARARALVTDALDGRVDDPELADASPAGAAS